MSKTEKRNIKLYIDGSEVPGTIKGIEAEIRKLQKAWKDMEVGSQEYNATTRKIRNLKGILADHKRDLSNIRKEQETTFSNGANAITKYAAKATAAVAAISGVVFQMKEFRKLAGEREDVNADVKALTGLDDASVNWLEQTAITLSSSMTEAGIRIQQSATEIMNAYKLVGSAKPELLENKEALAEVTEQTLILAAASGMKLPDAVDAVTLSMNQYGASAEEAIRYTNVMAAGSKYGSAAVESVTRAILNSGVAASSAGVPIEQLVGLIETLAEKGIKDEVAGTGLKKFFLTLQTGADDTNPKVVGLYQALDNLAAKGLTATDIKKQFGEEGYNVASILLQSTEKVKSYTDAVTGTAVATEQAAIKSDTLSAKAAQAKNALNEQGILLAKELNPIISKVLDGMVGWASVTVEMIKWCNEHREVLVPIISALASYYASMGLINVAQSLYNSQQKISIMLTTQYRSAVALGHVTMTLFSHGLTAARLEMALLNKTIKLNPIGLLVSLITTLVVLVAEWKSSTTEVNQEMTAQHKIQKDLNDINQAVSNSTAEEITKINILSAVIHDNSRSVDDRRRAIQKLQKIIPDYKASISDEGKVIGETTKKIKDHIASLKEMAMAQAVTEKMTNIQKQRLDIEESRSRRNAGLTKRNERMSGILRQNPWIKSHTKELDRYAQDMTSQSDINANAMGDWLTRINPNIDSDHIYKTISDYIAVRRSITEAEKWVAERDQQLGEIDVRESNLSNMAKNLKVNIDKAIPTTTTNTTTTTVTSNGKGNQQQEDQTKQQLLAIETDYIAKKNKLKEEYRNGDIQSESQYQQQLLTLELQTLDRKLAVTGLDNKERETIKQQVLDKQLELKSQIKELTQDITQDSTASQLAAADAKYLAIVDQINYAYDNGIIPTEEEKQQLLLNVLEEYNQKKQEIAEAEATNKISQLTTDEDLELLELQRCLANKLITEEDYERQRNEIALRYAQERLNITGMSQEQSIEAHQQYYEKLISQNQSNNSKMMSQYNSLKDSMADFTTSLGGMMGKWMAGEKFSFKEFSKEILVIALEAVEKMLLIKYAEIATKDIATKGWAGVATAAAKFAAIKGIFAIAKGAVASFDVGGYTGHGPWNKPQGIVHSNEFVANRFAVNNPSVKPVLDLIDRAQRSNTIAQLTSADIAAVANGHTATTAPAVNTSTVIQDNSVLLATLNKLNQTMIEASEAYKQPVAAHCWVTGEGGINQAQTLMNKIQKNVNRKKYD